MKLAKTTLVTWAILPCAQQELLARLVLPRLVWLDIVGLDAATLRVGDRLLELGLVEYRDLTIRPTDAGTRMVIVESGRVRKAAV